jgi:lambda repressor-like predicted transcriptional regulator|tara:strand:- start:1437 stop:1637 length:201 start_codon:yes stop_codon:yes gene_type:complete
MLTTQDFMLSVAAQLTKSGFKMKDLSTKINLSQSSLSDAKQGRTQFTLEKAALITKAVNEMVNSNE